MHVDQRRTRMGAVRMAALVAAMAALAALALVLPVAAQTPQSVTVELNELNGSGISGSAVLTAEGDMTKVDITLQGATGGEPVHIHKGTCANLDPNPLFPLTPISADGTSSSTVAVTLDALLKGQYAINVHKSNAQIGVYVACGDIAAAAAGPSATATTGTAGTTAATGGVTTPPSTGAGTTASRSADTFLLVGLVMLALTLVGGGFVLRRREARD